jgi:exoribonuclease-2
MLPEPIATGAASLQEGQVRPALSFLVDLDPRGEIVGYRLERSTVRSRARLDYAEADRIVAAGEGPFAATLGDLARLAGERERRRAERGAVLIRAAEVDVWVGADGRPVLERIPPDSPARRMVTESMVLAGEVAAGFCREAGVPAIYRRQPEPEALPPIPSGGAADPVLVRAVRRCLKRGEASLKPGGHYALGLAAYAQISSPLRRYQDLAVHRQIAARLRGEPPPYSAEELQRIAASTERAEADARRAERAAGEYWLLKYLEERVGQELPAVVVEVKPRPVVQLEETLREQPMAGLSGAEPGQRVVVRVERVNPRAGLLVLG